jgi:hypothetical protein
LKPIHYEKPRICLVGLINQFLTLYGVCVSLIDIVNEGICLCACVEQDVGFDRLMTDKSKHN